GMVECVEELAAKLKVDSLGDRENPVCSQVEVHRTRSSQRVASYVPKGIGLRYAEAACVKPLCDLGRLRSARVIHTAARKLGLIVAVLWETERRVVARSNI